jgi:biotin carboxyl carrier protein
VKSYQVVINGRTYHVEIEDLHASPVNVKVDGEAFAVTFQAEASAAAGRPRVERVEAPPVAPSGPTRPDAAPAGAFVAPMPGVILAVSVAAGQTVTRGQELCILEAMKMKNSLKSPRDGVIAEIKVTAGQTVAHGDVLVMFQ